MVLAECLGPTMGLDVKRTAAEIRARSIEHDGQDQQAGQIPASYYPPASYAFSFPGYAPVATPPSYPSSLPYPANEPNPFLATYGVNPLQSTWGNNPLLVGLPPFQPAASSTLPSVGYPLAPLDPAIITKMTQMALDESDELDTEEESPKPKRTKTQHHTKKEHHIVKHPKPIPIDEDDVREKVLERIVDQAALTQMGLTPENLANLYGPNTAQVENQMRVHQLATQDTYPYNRMQQRMFIQHRAQLQGAADMITSWAAADAKAMANKAYVMAHGQVQGQMQMQRWFQ